MISLRGPTLGDTVVRTITAALILAALVLIVGSLAFGRIGWWRADVWKGRAEDASQAAAQAQTNAHSANAGAANASQTRARMDASVEAVQAGTEENAQKVEGYGERPIDPADSGDVDADVLRDLEAAQRRARASAARLRGTGAR